MSKRLQTVHDFLLFSVMGITVSDVDDPELLKFAAIRRAYRDAAAHVLQTENNKKLVREPGIRCLMNCISLGNPSKVGKVISSLMNCINSSGSTELISIGIAQKWVAMTYKYIAVGATLAGKSDIANRIVQNYTVPLDRFILKEIKCAYAWSDLNPTQYEKCQESVWENLQKCDDLFVAENNIWIKNAQNDSESVIREYRKIANRRE